MEVPVRYLLQRCHPKLMCKRIILTQNAKCLTGLHKTGESYENNVTVKEVFQMPTFFSASSLAFDFG